MRDYVAVRLNRGKKAGNKVLNAEKQLPHNVRRLQYFSRNIDNQRIAGLDGLRGVAVLCVLAVHTTPPIIESGFFGVDVFFVLSGFLITSILLHELDETGAIDLRQFYIRRALRILPAIFAVIIAVLFYAAFAEKDRLHALFMDAVAALLFYFNWVDAFHFKYMEFTHFWSLSIEEQFYIVWPSILLVCMNFSKSNRMALLVLGIGVIGPEIGRVLLWPGASNNILYFRTELRIDALSWGALAAIIGVRGFHSREFFSKWKNIIAFISIIIIVTHLIFLTRPWTHFYLYYGAFSLVAIASAALIFCISFYPPRFIVSFLEFPPIKWIGVISYGLYLWHWPVFLLTQRYLAISAPFKNTVAIILSIILAAISFFLWERPFLQLKRHFQPRSR